MHLTPEEAQNSELLRNLAAQQALQQQQAQLYAQQQRYSHGWHDPRALQDIVQPDRFPSHPAQACVNIRKKLKPHHYLFALSLLLVIIAVIFGV